MPSSSRALPGAAQQAKPFSFWRRLEEIGMFFEGRSPQHRTMRRLVKKLEKAGISYAIMAGMAVNAHQHERTTRDVDVLLTQQGLDEFRRRFVPNTSAQVPGRPRRFLDRRNKTTFDILVTGFFPGRGNPGPIAFPDPDDVKETIENIQVVSLPTLVQLKLAARRHYD